MKLFEYIDSMNQPYDIFCTDNVHSPLHWHYYSEILYIYSGSILIECNNKSMILKKGDLCYFYPLQLHSVKPDPSCDEAVNYAVIKFNIQTLSIPKAYLQTMYDSFVHRNSDEDFCLLVHQNEKIPSIVKNILDEYECKELMHMLAVQSGIYTLLIEIARNIEKKQNSHPEKPEQNLSFYHILEYIDAHSAEPLEVQVLADMCHLSYSHFAKLFRENYGRSCKEYIQYIRMNKAQDLLLNSDFDINYIAQETGFMIAAISYGNIRNGVASRRNRSEKINIKKSGSFDTSGFSIFNYLFFL